MAFALGQSGTNFTVKSPGNYRSVSDFSCSEIGSFSVDENRYFYSNDDRELHRMKSGNHGVIGTDLSAGFTRYTVETIMKDLDRPLDGFLYWIAQNKERVVKTESDGQKKTLDVDFVITRGTMKRLLATVFNTGSHKSTWKMYATKFNGAIYISHIEETRAAPVGGTREPKLRCSDRDEEVKKIIYMGKKFEETLTERATQVRTANPGGTGAGASAEVHMERQGFYSVSRATFGGRHRLLTRCEVDCTENGKYIEMKLCLEYIGRDGWKFPMYKLREWWYHMYAGDMKKILYGIRDGPRLVRTSSITLDEIPSKIQQYPKMSCPPAIGEALQSWNPRSCVGFVDEFLQWLKGVVVEDSYGGAGPSVQYLLEWDKVGYPEKITCSRELVKNCSYDLLPGWFTKEMAAAFNG